MKRKSFKSHRPILDWAVVVRNSPGRGRGVFALENIDAGMLIEACPVLVFGPKSWQNVEKGPMGPYVFAWKRGGGLALGITSMLNHSATPNAEVVFDYKAGSSQLVTIQAIRAEEEITIDYGPTYQAAWLER